MWSETTRLLIVFTTTVRHGSWIAIKPQTWILLWRPANAHKIRHKGAHRGAKGDQSHLTITILMFVFLVFHQHCKSKSGALQIPCFNAFSGIFAFMNCSVLALSAVFCSGLITQSAGNLCSLQWHILQQRVRWVCGIVCMLCHQTSPKRWFANMNATAQTAYIQ